MISRKATIPYPEGLHIRPASQLAKTAQDYASSILLVSKGRQINVKSMLALLGACIQHGDEVEFIFEGEDEEQAMEAILALLKTTPGYLKLKEDE